MKRILNWIFTLGTLLLLGGCVEGLNGAGWADLEGGSEAGNPPAGDRPETDPSDIDPDMRGDEICDVTKEDDPDCPLVLPRQETKSALPIVVPEQLLDKAQPVEEPEEPTIKLRPSDLQKIREILEDHEDDSEEPEEEEEP